MSNQSQSRGAQDFNRIELMPASFTMRVGNRRLTMSWRPRKPVPLLLSGLLRRSWRAMFGRGLRISMTAAAICAAWNVPAMAAAPGVNTLPTTVVNGNTVVGGVITAGTATIVQNGNTLNINQSSSAAIGTFTSFSIGANAVVDIRQTSASNAFLGRVTGSDPTQIYGLLKSNGTVVLVNQNGLMVGPGGVVDVARFIGSTLDISDSDFLAGRLTFTNGGHAGNVDNQGTIQSATGGSVYLIGTNVTNSGVIHSPNGEILLAAGQTVQLIDTATPGVTVNVTGSAGSVTNLGTITAEAGRIGIAAGLINNSGNINASSVVSEGGRIFLRASQNLTTTATSKISADGTDKGGSVVLYSDGAAYLDGDISAQGTAGKGGYVETSGLKSLDVVKTPTVGSGGTWYIDPYDLEVVSDSYVSNNTTGTNAISSSGDSAKIRASTIVGLLNAGTDVTLTTSNSGGSDAGNITVSADINKVGMSSSNLTLNAENNITINANITSSGSALNLTLSSDYRGNNGGSHDVNVNHADISLNGGVLNVTNGNTTMSNPAQGGLNLNSGSRLLLTQANSALLAAAVTVDNTSSLFISQGSASLSSFINSGTTNITDSGTLSVTGDVTNNNQLNLSGSGNINIQGGINNTDSGTLNIDATSLHFGQTNSLNTSGTFNVKGGTVAVHGGNISGNINVVSGAALNLDFLNIGNATGATSFTGTGSMTWTGNITMLSNIALAASGPALTLDGTGSEFVLTSSSQPPSQLTTSNSVTINGRASLDPGVVWNNNGTINIIGSHDHEGYRLSLGSNAELNNLQGGTISLTGPTTLVANAGDFNNQVGATLNLASCSTLDVSSNAKFANAGNITMQAASKILASNAANSGTINGGGTITASGVFTNNGVVTLASGSLTAHSFINSLGATVNGTGSVTLTGNFNNNGIVALGSAGSITAVSFNNNDGGVVNGNGTYTLSEAFYNNGTVSPGGDGTVGTLGIIGNFNQGSTGVLNIDIASASNYDVLNVDPNSFTYLDGTMKTSLLGSYVPVLGQSFQPLGTSTNVSGIFRHVLGDVVNVSGSQQMIKSFTSDSGIFLTMSGSEEIYFSSGEGGWGNIYNWSTSYFPTAIDNVVVSSGAQLGHATFDGIDTVNSITFANNAGLNISGGTVNVGNISTSGYGSILITGTATESGGGGEGEGGGGGTTAPPANVGVLNLSGTARVSSLTLSGGGTVNGGSGSILNVTDNFSQTSAGVINSSGTVALSSNDGNLVVGNITARNLVLEAQNGAISQGESSLHVTQQLLTSSATGTTLNATTNRIAAFAGNNRGINDIVFVNNLNVADTSVVKINGVTNANGSISLDNTGAAMTTALGSNADFLTTLPTAPDVATPPTLSERLTTLGIVTNGTVSASMLSHTVTIGTHSPLTIGTGGVNAAGNIILSAGNSGSPLDNLVINGAITSAGGNINLFAGNSMSVNANISTSSPGQALFAVTNGVLTYAPGVSVTDVNGTIVPVAAIINQVLTPVVTPVIQPSIQQIISSTTKVTTTGQNIPVPPTFTASTNTVSTPSSTQTIGGTAGTFGGDDGSGANANAPKKPLPVCT